MLVLSRKPGEAIRIGNDTVVVIQSIRGNRVSVAVEAPSATKILRGELLSLVDSETPCRFDVSAPSLAAPAGVLHG